MSRPRGPDSPVVRRWPRVVAVVGISAAVAAVIVAGVLVAQVAVGDDEPTARPRRVLLVGDSIMKQAGVHLEETLEADPDLEVEVRNAGVNGSGLLTPGVYDWMTESQKLVDQFEPDVVVVLFVGNYTSDQLFVNEAGLEVEGYGDQFFAAWEAESRRLQQQLAASGADIYWVNPPPMLTDEGVRRLGLFRLINRGIAEDWTGTVLIDGTRVLSTDTGGYAWELPDDRGHLEAVRTVDSVHLTAHGARILSSEIARQLTPSLRRTTSG